MQVNKCVCRREYARGRVRRKSELVWHKTHTYAEKVNTSNENDICNGTCEPQNNHVKYENKVFYGT